METAAEGTFILFVLDTSLNFIYDKPVCIESTPAVYL